MTTHIRQYLIEHSATPEQLKWARQLGLDPTLIPLDTYIFVIEKTRKVVYTYFKVDENKEPIWEPDFNDPSKPKIKTEVHILQLEAVPPLMPDSNNLRQDIAVPDSRTPKTPFYETHIPFKIEEIDTSYPR